MRSLGRWLLVLWLVAALAACGAVDTMRDRVSDAAVDLRRAGVRFAEQLSRYVAEEGCDLLWESAPWAAQIFEMCEKQPVVEKTTDREKNNQAGQ